MNKWIPMNPYDAPAVEHWLIKTAGDEWKLDNIEGDRAYFVPAEGKHWRYRVVPTYPPPPTVPKGWVQVPTFRRVPLTVYETCDPAAPDFSVNLAEGDAFYRHWFWRCVLYFVLVPVVIALYAVVGWEQNSFVCIFLMLHAMFQMVLLLMARARWRSGNRPSRFRPVIRWAYGSMFGFLAVLILFDVVFSTQMKYPIFSGDLMECGAQLPCPTLEELSDRPITKLPAIQDTVKIVHFFDVPTRIEIKEGVGDEQQTEYKKYWMISQTETALQEEENRLKDWGYSATELDAKWFDRAVFLDGSRNSQILLLQKDTVFLNVFVDLAEDLREHLDDYAAALEAYENGERNYG